jgi:hypothetical protein
MNENNVKENYRFNTLFFKFNKRIATYRSGDMRTKIACFENKVLCYKQNGHDILITLYIDSQKIFENTIKINFSSQMPEKNILLYLSAQELKNLLNLVKDSSISNYSMMDHKRIGSELYYLYHYPNNEDTLDEFIFISKNGNFFVDTSLFYKNNSPLFKFLQNFTNLYDIRLYESLSNNDFYYSLSKSDDYEFVAYYNEEKQSLLISGVEKTNNTGTLLFSYTDLSKEQALNLAYEPMFRLGLKYKKANLASLLDENDFDVSNMDSFINVFDMYTF